MATRNVQYIICARAIAVRQVAAIGAKDAGRNRKRGSDHAGRLDVDAVDIDQVLRQPKRQSDESAEYKEIIERKSPDLDILERLELEPRAPRLFAACAACDKYRVVIGEKPEQHRHDRDTGGPYLGDSRPAIGDQDERREELRYRCADIAGAKNTERSALFFSRIPARNIGNADRERPASDAHKQRCNQELRIGRGPGQEIGSDCRRQHHRCIDDAAAILVGPDAESDSDQGSA